MEFFDFHHHDLQKKGIYNLHFNEEKVSGCFSVGLHPMDIDEAWETNFKTVKEQSQNSNCVAIGECGLDALVKGSLHLQKEVFKNHILWANEIQKPVIIHCVRLFSELLSFSKIAKTPCIIHGFNKKESVAKTLLEKGFYLSFGKAILHNVSLQNLLKSIPMNHFFLETDEEDFPIEKIYHQVANIKEMSIQELTEAMEDNRQRLFYG